MKRRTALAWWMAGSLASSVWAQDTRLAAQALHCSVVLDVLAQTQAGDAAQAARLQRAVGTFTEVHLQALGEAGPAAQTQAGLRRSQAMAQLRSSWHERAAYFREDAVVCGAWAEGFLAQGERYRYLVVYPKVVAPSMRSQYQALADDALQRWGR